MSFTELCERQTSHPYSPYRCPACQGLLDVERNSAEHNSKHLACTKGHRYPLDNGMPRFVVDEGYSESFGFQWQTHQATQLDSVTNSSLSRDRLFRGTGWPTKMGGETILEAGCGSGRFTEVLLSTDATVVSFDYSRAADVTYGRFAGQGVTVCQASIYEMPYAPRSFDRVFCYGVLQHCPDVKAAFMKLVEMVKPGGHLAVDVYDSRKKLLNARYRVRWITTRMDKQKLYRWCRKIVPLYIKLTPPLHPWNQLIVPIKDYRGVLPGLTREREIEWSVLDTFDALSPAFDSPQSMRTMRRWCEEAGLTDVHLQYGGNGVEVQARRPV